MPVSSSVTWLSYDELAEALGIERESARRLVIRKRWRRSKGDDHKARVEVPNDELPARIRSPVTGGQSVRNMGDVTASEAGTQASDDTGGTNTVMASVSEQDRGDVTVTRVTAILTRDIEVLTRHIERLEAEVADLRVKVSDRDLVAGQLEGLKRLLEEAHRERDEVRHDRDRWREMATQRSGWWPFRRRARWRWWGAL